MDNNSYIAQYNIEDWKKRNRFLIKSVAIILSICLAWQEMAFAGEPLGDKLSPPSIFQRFFPDERSGQLRSSVLSDIRFLTVALFIGSCILQDNIPAKYIKSVIANEFRDNKEWLQGFSLDSVRCENEIVSFIYNNEGKVYHLEICSKDKLKDSGDPGLQWGVFSHWAIRVKNTHSEVQPQRLGAEYAVETNYAAATTSPVRESGLMPRSTEPAFKQERMPPIVSSAESPGSAAKSSPGITKITAGLLAAVLLYSVYILPAIEESLAIALLAGMLSGFTVLYISTLFERNITDIESRYAGNGIRRAVAPFLFMTVLFLSSCTTLKPHPDLIPSATPPPINTLPAPEQLLPLDFQVPPELLTRKEIQPYYEIVRMGQSRDTKNIPHLLRILKQHNDNNWPGPSFDAVMKMTYPIGLSSEEQSLNLEITAGKLLEFIRDGAVHIMALYDRTDPSDRIAAAWALGKTKPPHALTKRIVISDLSNAMLNDKDAYVRAAAAWALGQYNDSKNLVIGAPDTDIRIKSLFKAIDDKEWLVRYYVVQALASSDDPRSIQPVLNLLSREDNPYVLMEAARAVFHLDAFGAVLPVIQATEKLKFDTSEDEMLFVLDSLIFENTAKELTDFADKSPQARRYTITSLIKAMQYLQAKRDAGNKYEIINNIYVPLFEKISRELGIKRAEIEISIRGLDERLAGALIKIVESTPAPPMKPSSAMKEMERAYESAVSLYSKEYPDFAKEIKALEEKRDRSALSRIALFDRTSTPRRVLAADALSRIFTTSDIRVLSAGIEDSHPVVRAAMARALRDYVSSRHFVYTGKNGRLMLALKSAASEKDWMTVSYIVDTLRLFGDSDALIVLNEVLRLKHPIINRIILESLDNFSQEKDAQTRLLIQILDPDVSESQTLIDALKKAKTISTIDPLLMDAVINVLIRFPANPEDYTAYAALRGAGIDCLRGAKSPVERLRELVKDKESRGDYGTANVLKGILQELDGERSDNPGKKEAAAPLVNTAPGSAVLASNIGAAFSPKESESARIQALDDIGRALEGTGDIAVTTYLLKLIESEPDSDLCSKAITELLKINARGVRIEYQVGNHPIITTLMSAALDKSRAYELRVQSIFAIGQVNSAESVAALRRILVTIDEKGLVFAAANSACDQLQNGVDEKGLTESLITAFLEKFDIQPKTVRSNPEVVGLYDKLVSVLKEKTGEVFPILTQKIQDEISRPAASYNEDRISNALYLASLIDEVQFDKLSELVHGPGTLQNINPVPQELTKQIEEWRDSKKPAVSQVIDRDRQLEATLNIFGQLDINVSAPRRAEALVKLSGIEQRFYLCPAVLKVIRDSLKDPDENVRIAAAYLFMKIDSSLIHHAYQTEPDVDVLAAGLTSPSTGFYERLFRIIALGKHISPQAARPILSACYGLENIYPYMERGASRSGQERNTLLTAVSWALNNISSSASNEIKAVLTGRLTQGNFNYMDVIPLTVLEKIDKPAYDNLIHMTEIKYSPRDPLPLAAGYKPGLIYDAERETLNLSAENYKKALTYAVNAAPQSVNIDIAMKNLLFDNDPEIRRAAARQLGEKGDPRSMLPLTSALLNDYENNDLVILNAAWALAQFESQEGHNDIRITGFQHALSKSKDIYVRSQIAHALGASGDPRAIELVKGLLDNKEDPLVVILASDSARQLVKKFKDPGLVRALLETAKTNYREDLSYRLGIGYSFTPAGQAAFDALRTIGNDSATNNIFADVFRQTIAKDLNSETTSIFVLHDVESALLKKCAPRAYDEMRTAMFRIKVKYWAPVIGMILFGIMTLGILIPWVFRKIIKKEPKLLRDYDNDKIIRRNLSAAGTRAMVSGDEPSGPSANGSVNILKYNYKAKEASLLIDDANQKCEELIVRWESILGSGSFSEEDFSTVLRLNYIAVNLMPLYLVNNIGNLQVRAALIEKIMPLIDRTINRLFEEIAKAGDDKVKAHRLSRYAEECVEIGRYFVDYLSALGYMSDLHISAGYDYAKNKHSWWQEQWGIAAITNSAQFNLAYLMEKIYIRGNGIVPHLYNNFGSVESYREVVRDHYNGIVAQDKTEMGIYLFWKQRKIITRLTPLVFGLAVGGVTMILNFPSLISSFTIMSLAGFFFKILITTFAGFIISSGLSWYFIGKGWSDEFDRYFKYHSKLDKFESLISGSNLLGDEIKKGTYREKMVMEENAAISSSVSRELDMENAPAADIILFMTGSSAEKSEMARNVIAKGNLDMVRKDTPIFAIDNGTGVADSSGDAFLRAYSLLDPEDTLEMLIDKLKADGGVISLNAGAANLSPKRRTKKISESRIIILHAYNNISALPLALANGYRITNALRDQGRSGVVNLNTDGIYEGPAWNFKDGITILSSWASQQEMMEQQLGLLITDDADNVRKYYEKFRIKSIRNWLEREILEGKYDMEDMDRRQILISTGILVTSFDGEEHFRHYLYVLKQISEYIARRKDGGHYPVNTAQDIVIPIIMLSQGENIFTYLDAHLGSLTQLLRKKYGIPGSKDDEIRNFYYGLFRVIEGSYSKSRPMTVRAQVFYPHEVFYSRADRNGGSEKEEVTITQSGGDDGLRKPSAPALSPQQAPSSTSDAVSGTESFQHQGTSTAVVSSEDEASPTAAIIKEDAPLIADLGGMTVLSIIDKTIFVNGKPILEIAHGMKEIKVGRAIDNDIVIEDPAVFDHHAVIRINDQGIAGAIGISSAKGETIQRWTRSLAGKETIVGREGTINLGCASSIKISSGKIYKNGVPVTDRNGEEIALAFGMADLKIGRHPDNDIVLSEPAISMRQAVIKAGSDGNAIIVDANSTNGTYVLSGEYNAEPAKVSGENIIIDDLMANIITRARDAKKFDQKLIIGLETSWIPGYEKGEPQYMAMNPLITELKKIEQKMARLGLDNVVVVNKSGVELADDLIARISHTNTPLSNIVVLASRGTIDLKEFDPFRSTKEEKGAFLASIDTSIISGYCNKHPEAPEKLYIRITEMLNIALGLSAGKEFLNVPIIESYDADKRVLVFLPKIELLDFEERQKRYDLQRKAMASA